MAGVLQKFCLGFERLRQLKATSCCFATKAVRASQSKDKFTELREPGALIGRPRYCGTARLIRQQNQMVMQEEIMAGMPSAHCLAYPHRSEANHGIIIPYANWPAVTQILKKAPECITLASTRLDMWRKSLELS
jgi:hypothetical protein